MPTKKRVLVVFGTRPEAIKLAPVILAFKESPNFTVQVCVTAQHREMLDQVLKVFDIKTDFDLNVMKPDQDLTDLTALLLVRMKEVLLQAQPEWVVLQGDTSTTFASSLAAFYQKIPIAHVEAGLRTYERYSPFPEEMNRTLVSSLANWHFPPTERARENLLREGITPERILVTGNTVIDALQIARRKLTDFPSPVKLNSRKKMILVTIHRRENFGEKMEEICKAIRELARREDVEIVLPVHLNPNVRSVVENILSGLPNVHLIEPQEYLPFLSLLSNCYFVLTDSGGIQEEAPALGKPVLILRESTERPEVIESGNAILVGTNRALILEHAIRWLEDETAYAQYAQVRTPFGIGGASQRIVEALSS